MSLRLLSAAAPLALLLGAPTGAAAQETAAESSETMDTVIVRGRAQSLYRVNEVSSAKLPTPPLLSTQTIQTINARLIEDQGARDAQDLYRNISGVTVFSYAGVTARGFRQEENFFDGLRGDPYAGFSVPRLFNIERVEFLKGPAGMLYGPGAPGGLFNYITKKPEEDFSAELSGVVGTEARYGASAQVTGAVSHNVSGRAGAFYETRNQPRWNADDVSQVYDAGLRFDLGRGALNLQATRYDQDLGGNRLRGVPTDDLGNFLADRRWNHNEPTDFLRMESNVLQATADYRLTDELTVDAGLRWNDGEEVQQYHEPRGLYDSDGDGAVDSSIREFRDQERTNESWSFGANAIWARDFGSVGNRVLAGGDLYEHEAGFLGESLRGRNTVTAGLPDPLALIDPEYGVTDVANYSLPARSAYRTTSTKQERAGAYLLDEITIGRFIGVAGVRIDSFEDTDLVSGESFEDEATTWRAGVVYRVRDDVSVFGQWAESFEPQSIGSQDPLAGGPFAPDQGEIWEAGVRTELMNGRIQSSASIYRIVRSNILQSDPAGDPENDGVDNFVALGEVTSEGFEFDITGDITPNWVATVSYGYNDARLTGDAGTNAIDFSIGDRFPNAPEHQVGFWTRYQFPAINTAIAFGGDYVDVRQSLSGQKIRPYFVFDASLIYETDDWRVLFRVDNLFDETYAASGFLDRTGHFPGDPRSMFLELSRLW